MVVWDPTLELQSNQAIFFVCEMNRKIRPIQEACLPLCQAG